MRLLPVALLAVFLSLPVLAQDESILVVNQMGSREFLKPGAIPGKVTVYVDGKETAGKAMGGQSGSRQFPVPKDGRVKIVAQDNDDWVFVRWAAVPSILLIEAGKSGDANAVRAVEESRELSFTAGDGSADVANAEFAYQPGSGKIDLAADYDAFLKEIKLTGKQDELDGVNGGQKNNTTLPGRVAISLVNAVMNRRNKTDNLQDCADPKEVWGDYNKNLKELEKALPMAGPAARRAIAAFAISSSADYEFWGLMKVVVKKSYGVELSNVYLSTSGGSWFGTAGNADGDFQSNVAEWLAALEKVGADATAEKKIQVFIEMALDPNQPGKWCASLRESPGFRLRAILLPAGRARPYITRDGGFDACLRAAMTVPWAAVNSCGWAR